MIRCLESLIKSGEFTTPLESDRDSVCNPKIPGEYQGGLIAWNLKQVKNVHENGKRDKKP